MNRTKKEIRKTGIIGELVKDRKEVEEVATALKKDFSSEYAIEAVHLKNFSYLSVWSKRIYVTS